MKQCKRCKEEKPLSDYYKHKQMADGHLNICKECTKTRVKKHREENIDRIREYDRTRACRTTAEQTRAYREKYPNKYRAHAMVAKAVKNGKLFYQSCEVCGESSNVHAHHDDYAKPLNVRWLCALHHCGWHKENGEAKNP